MVAVSSLSAVNQADYQIVEDNLVAHVRYLMRPTAQEFCSRHLKNTTLEFGFKLIGRVTHSG